jgi:hypothetical protein
MVNGGAPKRYQHARGSILKNVMKVMNVMNSAARRLAASTT